MYIYHGSMFLLFLLFLFFLPSFEYFLSNWIWYINACLDVWFHQFVGFRRCCTSYYVVCTTMLLQLLYFPIIGYALLSIFKLCSQGRIPRRTTQVKLNRMSVSQVINQRLNHFDIVHQKNTIASNRTSEGKVNYWYVDGSASHDHL